MYRHGDVLLLPVEDPWLEADIETEGTERRSFILARGEVTGHHHKLAVDSGAPPLRVYTDKDNGGTAYVQVQDKEATLTHQEHNTLKVRPGFYRVVNQREFDPEAHRRERRVID